MMEYMEQRGIECAMLDTFEYINPILSESIAKGYLISTKLTPQVYGQIYRMAEKLEGNNAKLSVSKLTSSVLVKKLVAFINDYDPDVIVCTHTFAAQILSHYKNKGKSSHDSDSISRKDGVNGADENGTGRHKMGNAGKKGLRAITVGIITDYTIHPFWEETDMDYYITASDLLNRQAQKKGMALDRILPLGIPIHTKFAGKMPMAKAREALGIQDKDTVFVMSGSMGHGNVIKIVEQLDDLDMDFQILSVCGTNKALMKKISMMKSRKKIYNYGYVDNVDVMMDASNCIVTKPGGLTISESLAKGLPMILINPIPGQEDRNVEFLLNNGLAVKITKTYPIDEAVFQLLLNPERTQAMIERIKRIAKPNATRDICDLLLLQKDAIKARR